MRFTLRLATMCSLLAFLGFGCVGTNLPSERPSDFSVEWHEGGGESQSGRNASFASGTCTITTYNYAESQQQNDIACQVTDAELDALYATLRAERADTVRHVAEPAHTDANNDAYTLRWGDASSEHWSATVVAGDRDRFDAAFAAITAFVDSHAQ